MCVCVCVCVCGAGACVCVHALEHTHIRARENTYFLKFNIILHNMIDFSLHLKSCTFVTGDNDRLYLSLKQKVKTQLN